MKDIMNKKLIYSIVIVFICMISIIGVNYNFSKDVIKTSKEKVILIDPGHGGIDGGAVSVKGTLEKEITLRISLKLRETLQKKGFKVEMTREEDKGLYEEKGSIRQKKIQDLKNRCELKKEISPDIFLSVHLNKFPQEKYSGSQVWYSRCEGSQKLAHMIQENLRKDLDSKNKRVEKAAKDQFKVLRTNDTMPSVIVECGFLSNYEEEKKLKTDEYQQKICESITKSIEEYFRQE